MRQPAAVTPLLWALALVAACGGDGAGTHVSGFDGEHARYFASATETAVVVSARSLCDPGYHDLALQVGLFTGDGKGGHAALVDKGTYMIGRYQDTSSGPHAYADLFPWATPSGEINHASAGTVTLESVDVGKHAAGHFDLTFSDGTHTTGSFDTTPCD